MDESLSASFAKADSLRRQIEDGTAEDTQVRSLNHVADIVDCSASVY
jgi:hypothetical protein